MSKRTKTTTDQPTLVHPRESTLKVYDKFPQKFNRKNAKVRFEICHRDGILTNIKFNIYIKFKSVANVNKSLNLEAMLLRLQEEANSNNIYTLELAKDDPIFSIYSIQNFKMHGNKILKTIEILLVDPIETITEDTKKLKLLENYHKDPLIGAKSYMLH